MSPSMYSILALLLRMLPFIAEVEHALDLHSLSSLKYIRTGHNLSTYIVQ